MPVTCRVQFIPIVPPQFPRPYQLNQFLSEGLVEACKQVQRVARENIAAVLNTTGLSTGALRESIAYEVDGLIGYVGSPIIYARIHELGGTIRAVNAPYLVFQTADGQWHQKTEVFIPARPYLGPAMDSSRLFIGIQGRIAIDRAMNATWRSP